MGNAIDFNGTEDFYGTVSIKKYSDFTIQFWMKTSMTAAGSGSQWWQNTGIFYQKST